MHYVYFFIPRILFVGFSVPSILSGNTPPARYQAINKQLQPNRVMLNSTQPSLRRRKAINFKYCLFLALCLSQISILHAQWQMPGWWPKMPPPKIHEYDICFPADVESNTCVAPTNIPGVQLVELGNDKLAVNISDKLYRTGSDACYKIFRTYTVMNWELYNERCQLDPMSNPVVIDRDAPDFDGKLGEGVCVLVRANVAYLSHDRVIDDDDVKINLSPVCLENGGFHYRAFMYTQVIKVYDDVRPVVTVPSLPKFQTDLYTCKGAIEVTFRASDNCTDQVSLEVPSIMIAPFQTYSQSGMRMPANFDSKWTWKDNKNGTFTIKIANLPEGKHDLIVSVRDLCGNLSLPTRIPFEVRDCSAPAPTCKQGLAMALMSDGQGGAINTIWASDFIASAAYDCNGQGPETDKNGLKKITLYSINRVGETPNSSSSSLTFDCAEAGQKVDIELHAWDNLGNHGYCVTYILVQDNRRICPVLPGIAGSIATAKGTRMRNINLEARQELVVHQAKTDKLGFYQFKDLPENERYVIRPRMKASNADGINTRDINLMLEILQNKLDGFTPYQLLAADVNQDGVIDVNDFGKLRQIYLQGDTFPQGNCWRFVAATHPLTRSLKPGTYPDSVLVNSLDSGIVADFIAIKLGDIDGSYIPSLNQVQEESELANLSDLNVQAVEKDLRAGTHLAQNQPNPFQDETTINFLLPADSPVSLSVWDVQGKSVYLYTTNLSGGAHQLRLDAQTLGNARGVFYYTLRTAFGTETRKMLRF